MAPKPTLPASILRTYTSLFGRRTAQFQASASRILGLAPRAESNHAVQSHFEHVARRIAGFGKLQPVPLRVGCAAQRRWHSTDHLPKSKQYTFEDVLAILETPSNSRLLIDVREPHEYEANTIPTAINIPVISQPDALLLSEEDFEDRFGFAKPPLNKEVVFFCKAGVRSSAAGGLARQAGYENVGEYRGSWLDWERRGGPGTKTPDGIGGKGEPKLPVQETKPVGKKGDSGEEDLGAQGGVPYFKGGTLPRQ